MKKKAVIINQKATHLDTLYSSIAGIDHLLAARTFRNGDPGGNTILDDQSPYGDP
jgi:hypothetical protein